MVYSYDKNTCSKCFIIILILISCLGTRVYEYLICSPTYSTVKLIVLIRNGGIVSNYLWSILKIRASTVCRCPGNRMYRYPCRTGRQQEVATLNTCYFQWPSFGHNSRFENNKIENYWYTIINVILNNEILEAKQSKKNSHFQVLHFSFI